MASDLKIYRGKPYVLNTKITIRQPLLGEICDFGEQEYLSIVKSICATPADRKVEIWDSLHIYWDEMDEYDLFLSMYPMMQKDEMSILFPNLDMESFAPAVNPKTKDVVLMNRSGVVIDRAIYTLMTNYLREVHGFQKNVDVGYDKYTKDVMIEDDRDEQAALARKPFQSFLVPIISSMTNCPEFKYRWGDVWELPIGVFMDAVARVRKHKDWGFTMQGIYSGCVDVKKINKKELNWMGELK